MLLLLFPCMQVLLLCSNYAHSLLIKRLELEEGQTSGAHLSPLSILTAVINGQNVTVFMLVAV